MVRSSTESVISAGIAMYGTWNTAKADAASRKNTSTHAAEMAVPNPVGAENVRMKTIGRRSPPTSRNGRRDRRRWAERSLIVPTIGRNTTSHSFGISTTTAATAAATPRLFVR